MWTEQCRTVLYLFPQAYLPDPEGMGRGLPGNAWTGFTDEKLDWILDNSRCSPVVHVMRESGQKAEEKGLGWRHSASKGTEAGHRCFGDITASNMLFIHHHCYRFGDSCICSHQLIKIFFWCEPVLKPLLNLLQYCFCFTLWFFNHEACGILGPQPGIKPTPPALEG